MAASGMEMAAAAVELDISADANLPRTSHQAPQPSQTNWQALALGFRLASLVSSRAVRPAVVQLDTHLQEASLHFIDGLCEHLCEGLIEAQKEIFAAKVPMASHGRIKDVLDKLKAGVMLDAKTLMAGSWCVSRTQGPCTCTLNWRKK